MTAPAPEPQGQGQPQPQSTTTTGSAAPGATPDQLGDGGKAAIAAERRARKAAEDQAAAFKVELDKIKQGQMSDLEKATARADAAEKASATATAEALRWRIAAKHGITDEDAETFLTGGDEATLTKQAERIAALSKGQTPPPGRQPGPRPDLSQGGQQHPGSSSPEQDFADFLQAAIGGRPAV